MQPAPGSCNETSGPSLLGFSTHLQADGISRKRPGQSRSRWNQDALVRYSANYPTARRPFDAVITIFTDLGDHWSLDARAAYLGAMEQKLVTGDSRHAPGL